MTPLRIMNVDLWEGHAHVYYTGQLVKAFAAAPNIETAFLHSLGFRLPDNIERVALYPVRAPQNLAAEQLGRVLLQPLECLRALDAIRAFAPDVIHLVFSHPWFSFFMPLIARRWPVAVTMHDVTPHIGEDTFRARLALKNAVHHASAIFVHGPASLADACARYPEAAGRIHSIPHGHFDFLNPSAEIPTATEPASFLLYGRLLPYKGVGVALAALELLLQSHPTAKLILAGAGSLDEHADALRRLGLHVELIHRAISDDELAALMRRCGAVLAPYTHASGSGVVATACAFGRPVIGSRLGGLIDMIYHERTGLLVPPGDPAPLAAAMARLIEDPAPAVRMGREAKRHALQAWDWTAIRDQQLAVFEQIRRQP